LFPRAHGTGKRNKLGAANSPQKFMRTRRLFTQAKQEDTCLAPAGQVPATTIRAAVCASFFFEAALSMPPGSGQSQQCADAIRVTDFPAGHWQTGPERRDRVTLTRGTHPPVSHPCATPG
jgi:hypothetical protein